MLGAVSRIRWKSVSYVEWENLQFLTAKLSLTQSWPAILAVPDVGFVRLVSILMVVVLPAPFGPSKPKNSPLGTSKLMALTAVTSIPLCQTLDINHVVHFATSSFFPLIPLFQTLLQ